MTEKEESSVVSEETQGVKRPCEEEEAPEEKRSRVDNETEGEAEGEDVQEAPEAAAATTEQMLTLTELLDGLNSSNRERADASLDRFMRVIIVALQHQRAVASGRVDGNSARGEAAEELVHAYLRCSPQVNELLALWKRAEPSSATAQLVVSVLGLLLQANVYADTRPVSGFVARTVTRTRLKALLQLMGDARYLHVVPALRLLGAIVALGPATARDVFQRFDWRADAVTALPTRRARAAATQSADFDYTQNVRTHYVRFCLGFLRTGSAGLVQAVLCADTVLPPLFDGIAADPAPLLRELLGTVARCAVRAPAVPRRLKLRLLTPTALERLATILGPRHRLQHPHDHDACARAATAFLQDCFAALASPSDTELSTGATATTGASATGAGESEMTSSTSTTSSGISSMTSSGSMNGNEGSAAAGDNKKEGEEDSGPVAGTGSLDVQELASTGAGAGGKKNAVLLGLARALCASTVVSAAQRRTVAALLHHRPALAVAFFRGLALPDAALSVPWLAATALVLDVLAVLPVVAFGGTRTPPPQPVLALAAEHTVPLRRTLFARALGVTQPPLVLLRALDVLVVLLRRCQRAVAAVRARGAGWELAEYALKSLLKARLPSLQTLLALRRHCADASAKGDAVAAHDLVSARLLAALALALQTFPELVAEDGFHTATLLAAARDAHAPASPLTQHALLRVLATAPDFALARTSGRAAAVTPAFAFVLALACTRTHPAMARAAFAGVLRTLRAGAGLFAEPDGALQLACWLARCTPADVPLLCATLVDALRLPEGDGAVSAAAASASCTSVVLLEHLLARAGVCFTGSNSNSVQKATSASAAEAAEQARAFVLRIVPDICLFAADEVAALLGRCDGDVAAAAQKAAQTPDDYAACAQQCAALTPAELLLPHSVPTIVRFVRLARHIPPGSSAEYIHALGTLLASAQKVRHRVGNSSNSAQNHAHSHAHGDKSDKSESGKTNFYSSCLLCSALCFDDVVFELLTTFGDAATARQCAPLLPRLVGAMAPCSAPRTGAYLARIVDTLLPLAGAAPKQPLAAALVTCLPQCPAPVRQRFVDACMDAITSVATSSSGEEEQQQQEQELATLLLRNLRPGTNQALLARHEAYAAALLRAATATPDALYDAQLHRLLVRAAAPVSFQRCAYALFGPALAPAWERYALAAVHSARTRAHTAPAVAACVRQAPHIAAAVLAAWQALGCPVAPLHVALVPALAAWRDAHTPGAPDVAPFFTGDQAEQLLARALPTLLRSPDPAAAAAFVRPFARGAAVEDYLARLEHDDRTLLGLTPAAVAILEHYVQGVEEQEAKQEQEHVEDKMEDDDSKQEGSKQGKDREFAERVLVVLLRRLAAAAHERPMSDDLAEVVSRVLVAHSARLPVRRLRHKDDATAALWRDAAAACGEAPRACTFRALARAVCAVFAGCKPARRRHRLAALQDALAPHLAEYADAPSEAQARFLPPLCALLRRMYALEPALCAAGKGTVMPALARVYGATTARADRAVLAVLRRMDVAGCPLATVGFAWGNLAWSIAHGTGGDLVQSLLDPAAGMIDPDTMARSLDNYPFHRVLPSATGAAVPATAAETTTDGNDEEGKDTNCGVEEEEKDLEEELDEEDVKTRQETGGEAQVVVVYDPVYLVPVLLRVAAAMPADSVRPFLDSGCLQYAVLTLSSPDGALRQAGYAVLAKLLGAVQRATFPDKRQTLLLLGVLRNSVAAPGMRLPLAATAFLVRAASVLRRPDHALYMAVSRYLLARPALALGRVPMFVDCLLQTDPRRIAAHRVWELRVLAAAVAPAAAAELRTWHAARVLDTLCAEHANPACDRVSRTLIEAVVARVLVCWARPPSAPRAAVCAALLRWFTSVQQQEHHQQQEEEQEQEEQATVVCSDVYAGAVVALATGDAAVAQMVAPELVEAAAVLLRAGRTAQGLAVLGAVAAVVPPMWQPPAFVALLADVLARAVDANDVAAAQHTAAAVCALVPPEQARPAAFDALLRRVADVLPREEQTRHDIAVWLGDIGENDE